MISSLSSVSPRSLHSSSFQMTLLYTYLDYGKYMLSPAAKFTSSLLLFCLFYNKKKVYFVCFCVSIKTRVCESIILWILDNVFQVPFYESFGILLLFDFIFFDTFACSLAMKTYDDDIVLLNTKQ